MLDEDDSATVTVIGDEEVLTERLLISFNVAFVMSISKLADVNDITVDDLEDDSVGEDGAGSSEELSNLSVVETD